MNNRTSTVEMITVRLDEITLDPNNARTHTDEQIAEITRSIQRFGFVNPVLLDDQIVLIAGEGRYYGARAAGLEEVPAVKITGLTAEERTALALADNRIALSAGWDYELVKSQMITLRGADFEVGLTGFSDTELMAFFGDVVSDPSREWDGMPEFDQDDMTAVRSIKVNFASEEDVEAFEKLIGQKLTRRSIWFPEAEIDHNAHLEFREGTEEGGK